MKLSSLSALFGRDTLDDRATWMKLGILSTLVADLGNVDFTIDSHDCGADGAVFEGAGNRLNVVDHDPFSKIVDIILAPQPHSH